MTAKQIGLEIVLFSFLALNASVMYQYGYSGFFELALANAATVAVFVDLTIALSLVLVWMWGDARERGVSLLPYLALTLTLGSVGPLLYLIRRKGENPLASRSTSVGPLCQRGQRRRSRAGDLDRTTE